jgi:hypothetical protein
MGEGSSPRPTAPPTCTGTTSPGSPRPSTSRSSALAPPAAPGGAPALALSSKPAPPQAPGARWRPVAGEAPSAPASAALLAAVDTGERGREQRAALDTPPPAPRGYQNA